MKKRLVILLAGLLTVLSMGFGLAQFSDVPAGHWAKEAAEALAAKGLITGFPDGTFRGNETLTRYQAALIIYRLLQQIEAEMKAKGESPTLEALSAEDLQALRNAVQELASELASLGVRVSALEDSAATKDDIARLEAMLEELKAKPMPEPGMDQAALQDLMDRVEAASIAADTALAQAQQLAGQLDALAQEVEGVKGGVAGLQTQVEANAGAIQALNELAVLLNQDVLALQDRVNVLEKMVSGGAELPKLEQFATKEDVAAVQEFAAALRSDLVNLSEKVGALEGKVGELSGKVSALERNAFTISGSLSLTYFSSDIGTSFSDYDLDRLISGTFLSTGDGSDNDDQVVNEADPITPTSGSTKADLSLKIQTGKLDAKSSGGANAYPGLLQFSLTGSWTNLPTDTSTPSNLEVDAVKTTLTVAEGQTLSFTFGQSLNTKFTEYVMDNEDKSLGHGFVATLKGLPFGASLTGVYGEVDPNNTPNDYVKGIRLALQPAQNFSLGVSYAQHDASFQEVGGVDATLELGPAKVSGEYFRFGPNILSGTPSVGGYVRLEVSSLLGFKANYRGLALGAASPAGLSLDTDNPYRNGQRGFTVELGLPVFNLGNLGLLYNAQMDATFGTPSASAFIVSASSSPLSGFALGVGVTLASNTPGQWFPSTRNFAGVPGPKTATDYKTALTATLKHDGQAQGALVKNLNLTVAYTNQRLLGGPQDSLEAYGDYSADFGPLSVKKVGLRYSDPNLTTAGGETLKAGFQAALDLSGLPLSPGLTGEVAYRNTQGTGTELKYGFGVKLSKFLFDKSTLEVKAAQYSTTGSIPVTPNGTDTDSAFDFSVDHLYATNTGTSGTLSGVYVTWTYWDLAFTYGFFKNGDLFANQADYGRVFRIEYVVSF